MNRSSPSAGTHSSVQHRFAAWTREEFHRSVLPRSLGAGVILFALEAIFVVSFSALIFKGSIAVYLPMAITYVLIGDAILVLLVSVLSSYPGSIAVQQDTPAVIISVAAASLVAAIPASAGADRIFSTVLFMILAMTLLLGLASIALGFFEMGGLVRFLPYPIMGGFLAGTGWLLVMGGIGVMQSPVGFGAGDLLLWVPGFVAGLLILAGRRKWPDNPILLVAAAALLVSLFYLGVFISRTPLDEFAASGWLLGPFPETGSWQFPLTLTLETGVEWPALLSALPGALPAILISVVALLLNATGMELLIKRDMDINRELVSAGVANIAAAFGGGLMGYHAISLTALNHTLSRGKRLPGLLVAALFFVTVFVGAQFLSFIPRLALGALLVYLGAELLFEWVVEVWKKFPKVDALIVMAILVTIILRDFLWGIGLGMVLTIVMFVVSYSRVNIIRDMAPGTYYRSRYNRQVEHDRLLTLHGDRTHVIRLEGFIFFGTANNLYEKVKEILRPGPSLPIEHILIDFAMVNGMDTTGLLSFEKMLQLSRERGATLVLSGLTGRAREQFESGGFLEEMEDIVVQPNFDRALEWCETRLIVKHSTEFSRQHSLVRYLQKIAPDQEAVKALVEYMEKRAYSEGEYLMQTGDPPDELVFIESGQVTIQLHSENEAPVRLETTGGGRVVGELGFFLRQPRTADVVADEETVAYILSQAALERIKTENPDALHALSQVVIHQTSQRVVTMTKALDALRK